MNISVILPTYNGKTRGFLKEAIESVFSQTNPHWELIIVNDGSSDDTASFCNPYLCDPRVRLISQTNKGLAAARNSGIQASRYPLIAFLDDDDFFTPTKLEKQRQFLEKNNSDMIYTAIQQIDTKSHFLQLINQTSPQNIYADLFKGNFVSAPSSVLIKRSTLDAVGGFRESLLSSEDYDLWFRVAKQHTIHFLDEPLTFYRIHNNAMSLKLDRMEHYEKIVLSYALENAPYSIQKEKSYYFHLLHRRFAQKYSATEDFISVRLHIGLSSSYHPLPLSWKLRYYLSFFPLFYTVMRKIWLQI